MTLSQEIKSFCLPADGPALSSKISESIWNCSLQDAQSPGSKLTNHFTVPIISRGSSGGPETVHTTDFQASTEPELKSAVSTAIPKMMTHPKRWKKPSVPLIRMKRT